MTFALFSQEEIDVDTFNNMMAISNLTKNAARVMELYIEMLNANIEPNVLTHQVMISTFVKARLPEKAAQVFDEIDEQTKQLVDTDTLLLVMLAYQKLFEVNKVISVYNMIIQRGNEVNPKQKHFANTVLLRAFVRGQHYQKAIDHFQRINKDGHFDKTIDVCEIMVKAYTATENYHEIYNIYEEIKDLVRYSEFSEWKNMLFAMFHIGKMESARRFYSDMTKNQPLPRFAYLHDMFKKETSVPKQNKEVFYDDVLELIIKGEEIPQTEYHLKAAFIIYSKPQYLNWKKAIECFDLLNEKFSVNSPILCHIIKTMMAIDNLKLTLHYFTMLSHHSNHIPDSISSDMIEFLVDRSEFGELENFIKRPGFENNTPVLLYTVNSFLNKKMGDHSISLNSWDKLITQGVPVSSMLMTKMLFVFAKTGDTKSFFKTLNHYKSLKLDITIDIYAALIALYGYRKEYATILNTINLAVQTKTLSTSFVTHCINAISRCGYIEEHIPRFFEYIDKVGPNPIFLSSLFEGCEISNKTTLIPSILKQWIERYNIKLKSVYFTEWMISSLINKNIRSAFYLVDFMISNNIIPQRKLTHSFVMLLSPQEPFIRVNTLLEKWIFPDDAMEQGEELTSQEFEEFQRDVIALKVLAKEGPQQLLNALKEDKL